MLDGKLSFLRALCLNNMSVASSCQFCRISFYPVNHRATGDFAFFILLKKNEEPVNLLKSMKLKTQGKYLFCKQKFKANNSDNSANKYYQVSNTFCVPMH